MKGELIIRRMGLLGLTGWSLAVVGVGSLFLVLWSDSNRLSYLPRLDNVAEELATQLFRVKEDATIAPVSFSDYSGERSQLGLFLSDELSTALQNQFPRIRVVNRTYLRDVLEEQRFISNSGLVSQKSSSVLGEIDNAEMLLVGRVNLHDGWIAMNAGILDVKTATTIASASTVMIATGEMRALWQNSIPTSDTIRAEHKVPQEHRWAPASPQNDAFRTLLTDFIVKNWPWVWAVLLVPIFTWLATKLRWGKSKTQGSTTGKEDTA